MKVVSCNEASLIEEFSLEAPTLWNLILSIATPEETRYQSEEYKVSLKSVGVHNAYFIMNHLLKLQGGNILSARAAMVGIFLETQGLT